MSTNLRHIGHFPSSESKLCQLRQTDLVEEMEKIQFINQIYWPDIANVLRFGDH